MTEAKQLKDRLSEHKMFYFEVKDPFYAKGGCVFYSLDRSKLMQVEATCKDDAVISVLRQRGMAITDESCERVIEITKEQYDILCLQRRTGELRAEAHDACEKSEKLRRVAFAALILSIASSVLSIGMLAAAPLVANGAL